MKTKNYLDFNFGVIAAPLYALNEQKEKASGRWTSQALASYYYDNARTAVEGKKEERENAVCFLLNALHNIAANLYNNGIDIEDYRRVCDNFSDRWEGKEEN